MSNFNDKVVVITGAGCGIGRGLAEVLCEQGSRLALADIDGDRLAEVSRRLEARGATVSTHVVDVGSEAQMEQFAADVLEEHGHVDVLINNAGIGIGGELAETSLDKFRRLMDINFWGVVYGVHFFTPHMLERRSGHVVNIASINGAVPFVFNGPYNASKFGVLGYTRTLRMEYARHNVGVTAVCPGLIRTNIVQDAKGDQSANPAFERVQKAFGKRMETRGASPRSLARAILKAIEKNQAVLLFPFDSKFLWWFHTFFPVGGEPLPPLGSPPAHFAIV